MGGFLRKLQECSERNDSPLCIGLDPDPDRLPDGFSWNASGLVAFNRMVIEATSDLVCAYKPNVAFYEALGVEGWKALEETLKAVPSHIPTIADAKRGDIPNTARMYAKAIFGTYGFDSATVNPYLGADSLEPFLSWEDKGVWVLCRNSNPGAADLQDLIVGNGAGGEPVYLRVLEMVSQAPAIADKGLVIGATSPDELRRVRAAAGDMPLLVVGLGTQGGDVRAAADVSCTGPVVINVSRSVLYGPSEPDVASAIRGRALAMKEAVNNARRESVSSGDFR